MLLKVITVKNIWFHNSFFNHGFKFQNFDCNSYHDLTMLRFNISNIAFIAVKGLDYRSTIHGISKSGTFRLLENSVLDDHGYI